MSDKNKTIQEALAEVQRNAELKRIQEAKAIWGNSLQVDEGLGGIAGKIFGGGKAAAKGAKRAKPIEPMPHGGEKLTPETPKGKRGPEEINIKPDTSTGKTKIEPAKPAEAPKSGGLASKILGFGLGAGLGTVVGDKLAKQAKDSTNSEPSAGMSAPAEPEKPKDSSKSDDMTFGQAFAAARKAATEKGAKSTGQFSWHGKDYQTNIQGKGTPKAPEEKYVAPSKQTKVDIGTKASAPAAETPASAPTPTPPKQSSGETYTNGREPGWRDTPPQPVPSQPLVGEPPFGASPPPAPNAFKGSTKDTTPIGPDPTKFTKPESESGGKKKKMSEETNPLIAAFLKLQESNPQNMFEAAKKAKKDYDKDGKIESPKDEVWGSRFRAAKAAGKMEEGALDPNDSDVTAASKTITKKPYVDQSTPTEPYKKAPMSTGAGDVLNKASDAVFNKKGIKEAYMAVLEAKKAKARTEDGYDRYGNLKNPEDRYDDNDERIPAKNSRSSSSDETNDIIKGSAPMKGLQNAGGYGAGEASDPGGRKSSEINDMLKGSAPIKGLVHSGGYGAGEASDPGGRQSAEINDIIRGSAPIKGLVHSGGYSGAAGIYGGNPPKQRPANIPKDEYEYFPGLKKDPKGLSYRAVDEAKKARTEDGISGSAPIKGLVHSGGYGAGEASDPGGRQSAEINDVIQKSAPIKGLVHSGGYDAVQRGEHLYKYNLSTGEKIPGGNAEMPAGWSPKTSGKSNWEKSKDWEPTPTTSKADAEKQQKWDAYKKTLKPLPKDMPEEVEFSQAEIDHLNSFFLEASVAPNRPEVATGADSVSDKMSQNDVTGTSTESGKKKIKEEVELEEGVGYPITGARTNVGSSDRKRKAVQMALGRKNKDHPDWNDKLNPQNAALSLGRKLQKQGVTEEGTNEEVIQEGRPKKNPTPETTERDPRKHIQVEAGRAAAGSVIDFHHNDGTKSKLTPAMGRKIVAHLQGLKPADRQAAVNKMHDSAEGLKV